MLVKAAQLHGVAARTSAKRKAALQHHQAAARSDDLVDGESAL